MGLDLKTWQKDVERKRRENAWRDGVTPSRLFSTPFLNVVSQRFSSRGFVV